MGGPLQLYKTSKTEALCHSRNGTIKTASLIKGLDHWPKSCIPSIGFGDVFERSEI